MEDDHWGLGSAPEHSDESPLAFVRGYATSETPHLKQAAVSYTGITDFLGMETATGPAAPTAYFAAILSSLSQKNKHSPDSLCGLAFLLARLYPLVPAPVLIARSEAAAELFLSLLKRHADITLLTKYILQCVAFQLRVLPAPFLASEQRLRLVQGLLVFTVDPRPKVRKLAQRLSGSTYRHWFEHGAPASTAAATADTSDEDAALLSVLAARGLPPMSRGGIPAPVLDTLVRFVASELEACSKKDCQAALYVCGALQKIAAYLPLGTAAKIFAEVLRLAAEGNPFMAIQTFKTLARLFSHGLRLPRALATDLRPSAPLGNDGVTVAAALGLGATDAAARTARAGEFVAQILASAADIVPAAADAAGSAAYLACVQSAFATLAELDPSRAVALAPQYIASLAEQMSSSTAATASAAAAAARVVVRAGAHPSAAVAPAVAQLKRANALSAAAAATTGSSARRAAAATAEAAAKAALEMPFARLVVQVQSLLGIETRAAWAQALTIVESLLTAAGARGDAVGTAAIAAAAAEAMGEPVPSAEAPAAVTPAAAPFVEGLLQTVGGIVASAHANNNAPLAAAAEHCIGTAVKALGPEAVLAALPLDLPANTQDDPRPMSERLETARAWLLPLIASNTRGAALNTFTGELLPLADDMLSLAAAALSATPSRAVEAKALFSIAEQLWACLPAFARQPVDLATAVKPFARRAAAALQSSELGFTHPVVCRALRGLVVDNLAIAKEGEASAAAAAKILAGGDDDDDDSDSDDDLNTKKKGRASVKKGAAKKVSKKSTNNNNEDGDGDDSDDDEDEDASLDSTAAFIARAGSSALTLGAYRPLTAAQASANVALLGGMAKNFLPLLFNVASAADPDERAGALAAVAAFAVAAPADVRSGLFAQALSKYVEATSATGDAHAAVLDGSEEDSENDSDGDSDDDDDDEEEKDGGKNKRLPAWKVAANKRRALRRTRARKFTPDQLTSLSDSARALADVLSALIPALDSECLLLLLRAVAPHLSSADPKLQRKSYQLVSAIVGVLRTCTLSQSHLSAPAGQGQDTSFGAFLAANKPGAAAAAAGPLTQAQARTAFIQHAWELAVAATTDAAANVAPAAVRVRLTCVRKVFTTVPDLSHPRVAETLPSTLSEAILGSKESNARTREAAFDCAMGIARAVVQADAAIDAEAAAAAGGVAVEGGKRLTTEFTYMILAGLAAATPLMKSATVTMLARLLFEFRAIAHEANQKAASGGASMSDDVTAAASVGLPPELLSEVLSTVTLLLQSRAREILKAVLGFIKVAALSLPAEHLMPQLGGILSAFSNWPTDVKGKFKGKIRTLYTVLIKKLGADAVRNATPANDVRLVDYLRKEIDRQIRRKAEAAKLAARGKKGSAAAASDADAAAAAARATAGKSFEELLADDDDEFGDGDDDAGVSAADALERAAAAGKSGAAAARGNKRARGGANDDGDEEVWVDSAADLLASDVHKHITTRNPALAARAAGAAASQSQRGAAAAGAAFMEDGRLNFSALEAAAESAEKAKAAAKAEAAYAATSKAQKRAKSEQAEQRKQKKIEAIKKDAAERMRGIGAQYASAKSGGDARRKDQTLDPFAYVPLDPRSLNKRATQSAQMAQFKESFAAPSKKGGQKITRTQRLKRQRVVAEGGVVRKK